MKIQWPRFHDSALSFATRRGERLPASVFRAAGIESERLMALPPWDPEILYMVRHGGWPPDEEAEFIAHAMAQKAAYEAAGA